MLDLDFIHPRPRPPTRHPRFAPHRGDLAVLAGRHYFLVHHATLAPQSSVLAALLDPSANPAERSLLEGCPILCLQDSPDDLALFLGALYRGLPSLRYDWADFSLVSTLLRLSSKYSVSHLRAQLIAGFSVCYPTTLTAWDEREKKLSSQDFSHMVPHPILVLKLAKEIQSPELMVSAFYDLSRNIPSRVAAGFRFLDDNLALNRPTPEELFHILKGREQGCRALSTFIVTELEGRELHEDCAQRRQCQMLFESVTFDLLRDINGLLCNRNSDVLFAIHECLSMLLGQNRNVLGSPKVCALCLSDFKGAVDRARREIWHSLPGWFGVAVESWG